MVLDKEYEESFIVPKLRLEYVERALKIYKQASIKVGTIKNLRKRHKNNVFS